MLKPLIDYEKFSAAEHCVNDKPETKSLQLLMIFALCCCFTAGVWRRSVSMAVWAEWRSLMSASPGRSRCPVGVSLRRWSGRWGRRRGSCSRTEQPSPAPLSFRPFWDQPPSSPCSSTSVSCSKGCPSEEVRGYGHCKRVNASSIHPTPLRV